VRLPTMGLLSEGGIIDRDFGRHLGRGDDVCRAAESSIDLMLRGRP